MTDPGWSKPRVSRVLVFAEAVVLLAVIVGISVTVHRGIQIVGTTRHKHFREICPICKGLMTDCGCKDLDPDLVTGHKICYECDEGLRAAKGRKKPRDPRSNAAATTLAKSLAACTWFRGTAGAIDRLEPDNDVIIVQVSNRHQAINHPVPLQWDGYPVLIRKFVEAKSS